MRFSQIPDKDGYSIGPARREDIGWVTQHVHRAIDELEWYNEVFKAAEKQRMNRNFLLGLLDHSPDHVLISRKNDQRAGLMISGPDNGVLFLYWSYLLPEFRQSGLAMRKLKYFMTQFDKGEFHKISTLTRPDNRVATLLMKRVGWTETAFLQNHIFGQDYKLFEFPLTKSIPGYRPFILSGKRGRLISAMKRRFRPTGYDTNPTL